MPLGALHAFSADAAAAAPSVATVTLNPMMGYVRAAYAARIDDDLVLGSRYDFNAYSFQSDLALGVEYTLRATAHDEDDDENTIAPFAQLRERFGVWTTPNSTDASLREEPPKGVPRSDAHVLSVAEVASPDDAPAAAPAAAQTAVQAATDGAAAPTDGAAERAELGIFKARMRTSGLFALLWEGQWQRCLVSVGLRTQIYTQPAISAHSTLGAEVLYLSE